MLRAAISASETTMPLGYRPVDSRYQRTAATLEEPTIVPALLMAVASQVNPDRHGRIVKAPSHRKA
jgi:hypothetical protein